MGIESDRSEEQINEYVTSNYGHDLSVFEASLRTVRVYMDLLKMKKRKRQFEKEIERLRLEMTTVIETIDDFLSNTGLWAEIQTGEEPWSDERKTGYIEDNFGLSYFSRKLDNKIRLLQKRTALLNGFHIETEDKRRGLQAGTLISLVWILAMSRGEVTNTQKFNDIHELLIWFSQNKPDLMTELLWERIELDDETIKANYDRYINNPHPTENQKEFRRLAESILGESTSPADA